MAAQSEARRRPRPGHRSTRLGGTPSAGENVVSLAECKPSSSGTDGRSGPPATASPRLCQSRIIASGRFRHDALDEEFRDALLDALPSMRVLATSLCGDDDSRADDLIQETLVRALSARNLMKPGDNLCLWLLTTLLQLGDRRGETFEFEAG